MNYDKLSLCGAAAAIRNGEISASELNRHCLEVAKKTAGLNAFVVIDEQYVLEQAAKTDEKIRRGEDAGAIAGVPVGVKDNMATEVLPTSCASKSLQSNTIERKDCGAVKKLREAGGVIFGKTNMDEFAMGFTGTNTAFGEVSNPYNKDYSAGGSSSGSARRLRRAACSARSAPIREARSDSLRQLRSVRLEAYLQFGFERRYVSAFRNA